MILLSDPPQAVWLYGRRAAWIAKRGRRWAYVVLAKRPIRIVRMSIDIIDAGEPLSYEQTKAMHALLVDRATDQYPDVMPKRLREALA